METILKEAKINKIDAWVQCDDCSKWRRVSRKVSEDLGDGDEKWYCKFNVDTPHYSSCNIHQELTNDEIDKLLAAQEEQSSSEEDEDEDEDPEDDASEEESEEESKGGVELAPVPEEEPAAGEELDGKSVIRHIDSNIYTYPRQKRISDDDVMVCQCTVSPEGTGCTDDCLNRMLCIECIDEYCPCGAKASYASPNGSTCNNQMFQRKKYAALEKVRTGKKGWGLATRQKLRKGQFITEYCGEVLDEPTYLSRKKKYLESGQRHYYFMTLSSHEVIDACTKGNLGRFTNHSCDPNCETQKWLVRGDLCIGLFALRDIEEGEELTFDYNFERYGDKPMRCLCGSSNCRGVIGGSPDDPPPEEDEDYDEDAQPEPMLVRMSEPGGGLGSSAGASEGGEGAQSEKERDYRKWEAEQERKQRRLREEEMERRREKEREIAAALFAEKPELESPKEQKPKKEKSSKAKVKVPSKSKKEKHGGSATKKKAKEEKVARVAPRVFGQNRNSFFDAGAGGKLPGSASSGSLDEEGLKAASGAEGGSSKPSSPHRKDDKGDAMRRSSLAPRPNASSKDAANANANANFAIRTRKSAVERRINELLGSPPGPVRDLKSLLQLVRLFKETKTTKENPVGGDSSEKESIPVYNLQDLSLILDIIKQSSVNPRIQAEFVRCNLVGTVTPIIHHLYTAYEKTCTGAADSSKVKGGSVPLPNQEADRATPVLRKLVKVLTSLPLKSDQVQVVRCAGGNLADLLHKLSFYRLDLAVMHLASEAIDKWKLPPPAASSTLAPTIPITPTPPSVPTPGGLSFSLSSGALPATPATAGPKVIAIGLPPTSSGPKVTAIGRPTPLPKAHSTPILHSASPSTPLAAMDTPSTRPPPPSASNGLREGSPAPTALFHTPQQASKAAAQAPGDADKPAGSASKAGAALGTSEGSPAPSQLQQQTAWSAKQGEAADGGEDSEMEEGEVREEGEVLPSEGDDSVCNGHAAADKEMRDASSEHAHSSSNWHSQGSEAAPSLTGSKRSAADMAAGWERGPGPAAKRIALSSSSSGSNNISVSGGAGGAGQGHVEVTQGTGTIQGSHPPPPSHPPPFPPLPPHPGEAPPLPSGSPPRSPPPPPPPILDTGIAGGSEIPLSPTSPPSHGSPPPPLPPMPAVHSHYMPPLPRSPLPPGMPSTSTSKGKEPMAAAPPVGHGADPARVASIMAVVEWKDPNVPDFKVMVSEVVRHRVWKYRQAGHWLQLTEKEAVFLHDKITATVVSKEMKAWKQHHTPINRDSLTKKLKKYVHDHVHMTKNPTAPVPGPPQPAR